MNVCVWMFMYNVWCVWMCVYECVCMNVCVWMCVWMCVYECVCINVCASVHICLCEGFWFFSFLVTVYLWGNYFLYREHYLSGSIRVNELWASRLGSEGLLAGFPEKGTPATNPLLDSELLNNMYYSQGISTCLAIGCRLFIDRSKTNGDKDLQCVDKRIPDLGLD